MYFIKINDKFTIEHLQELYEILNSPNFLNSLLHCLLSNYHKQFET